jgi:hypothetical protein
MWIGKRNSIAAALVAAAAACSNGSVDTTPVGRTGATLLWSAPESRVDGTPADDLAGFKVTYTDRSGTLFRVIDVGLVTSCTVTGLPPNTYFFTVSAYDTSLRESDPSNAISVSFP